MSSNITRLITFSFLLFSTACISNEKIVENYCKVEESCGDLTAEELSSCEEDNELDSEDTCYQEDRNYTSCISTLSCDEYDVWLNETEEDFPCKSEEEALDNCY